MTIGITPVFPIPTTPVGLLQKQPSQFTTHVHPVGVFLTEVVMVYGQRQDLMILHTTVQMKEYLSASHHLPQHGILLRVIATTTMTVSSLSVSTAPVGLHLLTATTSTSRTTCSSAEMATSFRRATTIARAVGLSVVSK
mgnify:CR=1 FL=1